LTVAQSTAPSAAQLPTRRAAYLALGLLTAINLLNYLDRYVVAPLVSSLKRDMSLSDTQLGLLLPIFILVYMLAAPLFGLWGDRGRRTHPIVLGIGLWSLATILSGLAQDYGQLLAARALVGVGEAAVVAITPALLADLFPPAGRARVFAVFNAALPVGAALGYVVGGLVGQHFGWRSAFFVAGVPGFILALATLRLPDPPRGIQEAAAMPQQPAVPLRALGLYRGLLRRGPYLVLVFGYAAYTFALGGLAYWMPTFLERVRGMSKDSAATDFGLIVLATGLIGTLAGGYLADRLRRSHPQAYTVFCGVVTVAAAPVAWVALAAPERHVYLPAIVLAQLLLFMSTGPVNAALVNAVSPLERASAAAFTMITIHLLGDVPSPILIGYLSDRLTPRLGEAAALEHAVLMVPVAILIGGLIWLAAARGGARTATRVS
jgi:MFS transporter, Spinster family, sphingosine-1-phosphate transporter